MYYENTRSHLMCGRFTLTADLGAIQDTLPFVHIPEGIATHYAPRYNIAPSQPIAAVSNNGKNTLEFFVWGLIPSWAKDPSIGNRLINARSETLLEKPSFRNAFRRRRCLVLADGFYEWRKDSQGKTPMFIRLASGKPFAFAGLWEFWRAPDSSEVLSCTIITTQPNDLMASIHNRMPVILPESAYSTWLEPGEVDPQSLSELLIPYPSDTMQASPVRPLVNNPRYDSPELIVPA
jgi:putative SOS response-associated peptidase YedK